MLTAHRATLNSLNKRKNEESCGNFSNLNTSSETLFTGLKTNTMKTILVPTDFSVKAENIIEYAAELAKSINARIILFHVYHPPAMISEIPDAQPMHDIEETCMDHLKTLADRIHLKYGEDMQVECQCQCGFAVDEIKYYQEHHKIDLIVMGMRGAGYLSERLMGSITTSLMYKSIYPVLAIGENVRFRPIQKIVLACDFADGTNYKVLAPLKRMAQLLGAHIHVLHVVGAAEKIHNLRETPAGKALAEVLEGAEHSFHYLENKDIVEGINTFIHAHGIDLTVMIPRTHSLLENIFQEPHTKRMAFHADVPLLSLHDE